MHSDIKHESIQKRHTKRQQKRMRAQRIRRIVSLSTLALIVLCIIVFFTPLLGIRHISVAGNFKVDTQSLEQALDSYNGHNLLLARKSNIKSRLLAFPYIESVAVKRKLIPPSLEIGVKEREAICVIAHNQSYVLIDQSGKILEVSDKKNDLTEIQGLRLTSANAGEIISLDDNSMLKTVVSSLEVFKKSGLMSGITKIDFSDFENITFNYENRIDGICGPYVDFSRKLSLFREAITSNKLTEHSRGTINLSRTGRAVYTP